MNNNENLPLNNVFPIRKSEKFGVYLGKVAADGEVTEGESVGIAFLKTGSKKFRLKIFMFPGHQYFIVPDEKDDTKYFILSLEEYQRTNGNIHTSWNRVGTGQLVGNLIVLRMPLLPENIFLSLSPSGYKPQEVELAA